jgi:hypothetical protein
MGCPHEFEWAARVKMGAADRGRQPEWELAGVDP